MSKIIFINTIFLLTISIIITIVSGEYSFLPVLIINYSKIIEIILLIIGTIIIICNYVMLLNSHLFVHHPWRISVVGFIYGGMIFGFAIVMGVIVFALSHYDNLVINTIKYFLISATIGSICTSIGIIGNQIYFNIQKRRGKIKVNPYLPDWKI